jgi:hypothetical protein
MVKGKYYLIDMRFCWKPKCDRISVSIDLITYNRNYFKVVGEHLFYQGFLKLEQFTTQINKLGDTLKYSPRALACSLLIERFPLTISETTLLEPIIPTKSV